MKKKLSAFGAFACVGVSLAAAFTDPSAWRLSRFAKIAGDRLVVAVPADRAAEGGSGRIDVDLSPFRDRAVEAEVRVRGENVTKGDVSWLGMKFMLHFRGTDGNDFWPQAGAETGSFGWKTIRFRQDMSSVSAADGRGELTLGMQQGCGRLEFDLSSLKLSVGEPIWPRVNGGWRVTYPARVAAIPVLRGVMLPGGACREEDFATLRAWGATLARYQMIRGWGDDNANRDLDDYDRWLDGKLDHLEKDVIPWARTYGVRLVVDLHVAPGGRRNGEMAMFHDRAAADRFVACWGRIARRFRGNGDVIFGYDLINEPQQQLKALDDCDYWNLQRRAAEAVRAADPDTTIIVESNGWDSPDAFSYLSPLAMDNVVYQAHMYAPHAFTHQGVGAREWKKTKYPDPENGWDKAFIRRQLEPVLRFRERHGARIYIGEFSAITWAEGADRYVADCISLFEEYGFDWTYHAFREWPGWSVEHTCDGPGRPFSRSEDNARMRALKAGLRAAK